jgi:hypothetical protein
MPPEALDQTGVAPVHGIDQVAYVQLLDGAGGTPQQAIFGRCEGDHRPMVTLTHPSREDAGHALVPAGLEQAKGWR